MKKQSPHSTGAEQMRGNSFHEKAGASQDVFVFTSVDSFPSSRAASVAILPSAVCSERFSLAARWAYSIQSVLRPDNRPRLQSIGRELGQELGAVTGSRRLSSAVRIPLSFFFFPTFSSFSQRNFKPGSSRNDDRQLRRLLASPVLWGALHSRPRRASLFGYCAVVRTPLH